MEATGGIGGSDETASAARTALRALVEAIERRLRVRGAGRLPSGAWKLLPRHSALPELFLCLRNSGETKDPTWAS